MFAVKINKSQFEYDVHSLVKAFYPEEMVKVLTPEMSSEKNKEWEENIRIEIILQDDGASVKVKDAAGEYIWHREEAESTYKNEFKKFLYKTLCDMTGKELPWGNLTGIRPTKIAMGLLEEGKTEEEIAAALQKEHFVSTEKADLSVEIAKREKELLSHIHYEEGYSLYIGIPFCRTRCLYCSFASRLRTAKTDMQPYLAALKTDIANGAQMVRELGLNIRALYLGGGTPTVLTADELRDLLDFAEEAYNIAPGTEFVII